MRVSSAKCGAGVKVEVACPLLAECCLSEGLVCPSLGLLWDRGPGGGAGKVGAKMGKTVRKSMPFNANHAFVHAVVICVEPQ